MVNTEPSRGGAARAAQDLGQALRRAGHDVRMFVGTKGPHGAGCYRLTHWRMERLRQHVRGLGFPDSSDLTPLLWRVHPAYAAADILHLHNLHGEFAAFWTLPWWARAKPLVWTLHDFWALTGNCAAPRTCTRWRHGCGRCPLVGRYPMPNVDRSRLFRWLKPRVWAAARPRLVTPSRWLAARCREIPALRRVPLRVIPHGVDTEIFAPCRDRPSLRQRLGLVPQRPTVVLAGNSWRDTFKGGADAAHVLHAAREAVPDLQAVIVGLGSEELLRSAELPGRALPYLHDPWALAEVYAAADVCLFPSHAENFPLTVLEALACGTAVVAYDVGGVREQLTDGHTGRIAADGNLAALAAALTALARDPRTAHEMGAQGRATILAKFSAARARAAYEDEYRRALRSWCRRAARTTPRYQRGRLATWVAGRLGWGNVGGQS